MPCFADSFWFLALLIRNDRHHSAAIQLAGRLNRSIVTSEYVLVEVMNALSPRARRSKAKLLLSSLKSDTETTLIESSPELLQRGIDLFLSRPDKEWSLTDCLSFVIMQEQGINEALTADHHFEQAGFVALLRAQA